MTAIYKRELGAYFKGIMGYIVVAFTLLLLGLYSKITNIESGYANFEYALESCSFLFIVLIPMITMRIWVEERRQRTDVLIFTAPVSVTEILLGKYLASLTVFLIPVGISCFFPLIFSAFGNVNLSTAYLGIFGFVLLGAALLSVGVFISLLTESYIVAVIVTFAAMLLMYLMGSLSSLMSDSTAAYVIGYVVVIVLLILLLQHMTKNTVFAVGIGCFLIVSVLILFAVIPDGMKAAFSATVSWLSIYDRFVNFVYGIFDITAVVYYLSVIFFFGFLSVQALEKRRWS